MKKGFVCLADLTPLDLASLLELAISLKQSWRRGERKPRLGGKTLAMVFQKPSLRTRVSFEIAMVQLGGQAIYLSPSEIRLGQRESIPDVARVLSRYVDAIMARVYAHSDVEELAEWATVPVINGLSDTYHPCQGVADLLTVSEKCGRLQGIKLAYVGDGNNVLHSLLLGGARMGMCVSAATPEGYEPLPEVVESAMETAAQTGAEVHLVRDPCQAVADADVVYTDTWTSMGQEEEAEIRRKTFRPYQVNAELIAEAKAGVGVMHCLPAHRGEEITDEVADGEHSWLFDQAENRLHAQKAILVDLFGREG